MTSNRRNEMEEKELGEKIYQEASARILADAAPLVEAFGRAAEEAKRTSEQLVEQMNVLLQQMQETQAGWREIISDIQARHLELIDEVGRLGARVTALEERVS
jgi:molecular chaperone GrpE (heat shock protein)